MPDGTLELADRLWRGEVPGSEYHPLGHRGEPAEMVDRTLEVMNAGGRLDDAFHSVRPSAHLESRPYLRPVRHRVFSARADAVTSTMTRGIFRWAAREAHGDPDG